MILHPKLSVKHSGMPLLTYLLVVPHLGNLVFSAQAD
jgi:hypothetical protein